VSGSCGQTASFQVAVLLQPLLFGQQCVGTIALVCHALRLFIFCAG